MSRYLITGASRGIGQAIAVRLAEPGRTLLLVGRDSRALQETSEIVQSRGAQPVVIAADLGSPSGVAAVIKAVSTEPLRALILNAGVCHVGPVEVITPAQWEETLAVNITAPFLLTQKLLPLLKEGSAIVNILSVAARSGIPQWSSYCMSKFALEGFTQSIREELRPRGIRVINVYPAATATQLWNGVPGDWPREKMLDPQEVAEAVAYALSRPDSAVVETISVGNIAGRL